MLDLELISTAAYGDSPACGCMISLMAEDTNVTALKFIWWAYHQTVEMSASTQHDWSDSVNEHSWFCTPQLMVSRSVWWQACKACTKCVAVYIVANACCSKRTHMSLHNIQTFWACVEGCVYKGFPAGWVICIGSLVPEPKEPRCLDQNQGNL